MYNAIIVDDEEEVLTGIIRIIDWARFGFAIAGQAVNGREALDMIEEAPPDVVITDITMPLMDGLELARTVRERFPTVKVAILTGFDDFKFAQQAIKYGVSEYLLKPVLPADIHDLLVKLKSQLDEEIAAKEDMDRLRRHYEQSLPILAENFLLSLVTGGAGEAAAAERIAEFRLRLRGSAYAAAALGVDGASLAGSPFGAGGGALANFAVLNIAKEILERREAGEAFLRDGSPAVLLALNETDMTERVNLAISVLEEIRQSVEKYLRFTVTAGLGRIAPSLGALRESCRTASSALEYRIVMGENRVIYYDDIEPGAAAPVAFDESRERTLVSAVKFGSEKDVTDALGRLFKELGDAKASPVDVELYFMEMLSAVSRVARVFEYDFSASLGGDPGQFARIPRFGNLADARKWFGALCLGLMGHIAGKRQNFTKMALEQAKEYIQANYGDNELTIQKLADELHISSSYLSMIFKKEAGETFLKYLVRTRLEAARELLVNTDMKSIEIAERIGYPDINYFSYFFKKNYGVSPREYRNRAKAGGEM